MYHVILVTQVITSICRQPMDTKMSKDCQFSQLFEEALEVSISSSMVVPNSRDNNYSF